jgi:hypothetical protein
MLVGIHSAGLKRLFSPIRAVPINKHYYFLISPQGTLPGSEGQPVQVPQPLAGEYQRDGSPQSMAVPGFESASSPENTGCPCRRSAPYSHTYCSELPCTGTSMLTRAELGKNSG